ncbi:7TM diverse intracellular signaling domain-containing protein [Marivirga arenosa]|uniref:histidine kinase n=1 Tax=Marivirga arenosa TaxID=3059076 RepID=A0AA49GH31_9BACT|nr:7TM diverse intracellular signaling domain-containing protein [Marivirga sp. ABR2-2]WKK86778.2 7TM diverse intracellular signaling domain-containing protein [Marivirga sp. ABR2-2]
MKSTYIYFFICINFFLFEESKASDFIELFSGKSYENIGKRVKFLEDPTNSLTYQDIKSSKYQSLFKAGDSQVPTYGLKDISLWVKVELKHSSNFEVPYVLEIAYPTFDSIQYFIEKEGGISASGYLGDQQEFNNRLINHKNFIIPLDLNSSDSSTVYLRIKNKGSLVVPLNIISRQMLYSDDIIEELLYGIFYGIMLVMLLYNLFLAVSARSINYLYYVGIITGNLLALSALNGHAFMYIWSSFPWIANHVVIFGIGLWISSSNLFASAFFETQYQFKKYHNYFRALVLVGIVIIILSLTIDYSVALRISNYSLIINCFGLLYSGIYFWTRKVKVASVFTLAWTGYLLGVLLITFRNLGIVPVNFITTHFLEFGAILEVILLSISLGYKYRLLEIEKKEAQLNSLDLMTQSQKLVQEQNEELERKVVLRTHELEEKQEEILQQNEELNAKNEKLTEAQQIIEAQNAKLKLYTDDLESQVEKRTEDLRNTNTELAQNVQKLEQYAFMTAHNLRAPVARLLGLTHLIEITPNPDLSEWTNIVSKIKEEGDSLDAVIKDLNAILELKKEAEQNQSIINLTETLNQTKRILKNSIEVSKGKIIFDNHDFNEIKCNPTYIDSIFYNLLSNAIKYRSEDRQLEVLIQTKIEEGKKLLIFSDNGVGIDLSKNADKIFGMYRRFHTHVEGKGLGLYLVKSQIEILGGEIKVESELDKGTTFTLSFPVA